MKAKVTDMKKSDPAMPRKRRDDETFESLQVENGKKSRKVKDFKGTDFRTYAQRFKRKKDQVNISYAMNE
jgi:hypothetical protein